MAPWLLGIHKFGNKADKKEKNGPFIENGLFDELWYWGFLFQIIQMISWKFKWFPYVHCPSSVSHYWYFPFRLLFLVILICSIVNKVRLSATRRARLAWEVRNISASETGSKSHCLGSDQTGNWAEFGLKYHLKHEGVLGQWNVGQPWLSRGLCKF